MHPAKFPASLGLHRIAYFQWRTAHQRVILDLFDRRVAAYERLKPPIIHALRHGVVDPEQFSEFARAVQGAKFFFGKDVTDYLEQVAEDLAQFETLSSRQDRLTVEQGESRMQLLSRLGDFFKELDLRVLKYMRFDQRMPSLWWPW
jgi:hypothetical protein